MANNMHFEAENSTVLDVFFNGIHKFKVPRYQRPYAWNEDEVSEFWNDLIGNPNSYFLGSFIFNNENLKNGYIELVDGQQRLLTITICLAALRDVAKQIDPKLATLIQTKDICIEQRDGSTQKRVACGETTRPFFEKYIQDENNIAQSQPSTKEETQIKENYNFFFNKIVNEMGRLESKTEKLDLLKHFRSCIE